MRISDRMFVIILIFFLLFVLFELVSPWRSHAGEVHGEFEVGYIPELEGWMTSIELDYFPWKPLRIRGGVEVLMDAGDLGYSGLTFQPYRNMYFIGIKLNVTKILFLELDHSCTHPVYSNHYQFYDKFEGGNRTTYSVGIQW